MATDRRISPEAQDAAQTVVAPHVHVWEPVGMTSERRRFFDGITNPQAEVKLAIRSCSCGAIRRTEVARRYL